MELGFEHSLLMKLRRLSPEKQREVLDFIEFLAWKNAAPQPLQSLRGAFADLGVNLSTDDIDVARQQAWGDFLRTDI